MMDILNKYWQLGVAILGVIAIGAIVAYHESKVSTAFDAGYDKRSLEVAQAKIKAVNEVESKYAALLNQHELEQSRARKLIGELEDREPDIIYREIEKVVEQSNCDHLGDDFVRLYNQFATGSSDG